MGSPGTGPTGADSAAVLRFSTVASVYQVSAFGRGPLARTRQREGNPSRRSPLQKLFEIQIVNFKHFERNAASNGRAIWCGPSVLRVSPKLAFIFLLLLGRHWLSAELRGHAGVPGSHKAYVGRALFQPQRCRYRAWILG